MSHRTLRLERDVEMKTRDGVVLRADILRPEDSRPVPAIVCRTPYDKGLRLSTYAHLRAADAASAGFAVVFQDIRGRFASDGEWSLMGWDGVERDDGYDTVEWVAAEPWCSGSVGLMGGSYEGLNALAAASAAPPGLRAIAPSLLGSANARRTTRMLEGVILSWSALIAIDVLEKRGTRGHADPKDMGAVMGALVDPATTASTLPLEQLALFGIAGMPTYEELTERLMVASAAVLAAIDQIEVPALWTTGWWDQAGGSDLYHALQARGASATAREDSGMIIGPWSHTQHDVHLGDLGFGQLASLQGGSVGASHLQFFGAHLLGQPSAAPGVRYFLTGKNSWRQASCWPPSAAGELHLYLDAGHDARSVDGDGVLSPAPPAADEAADHYRYDPADPVPSIGFRSLNLGGSTVPGPFDQYRVERRDDVLVYTSPPLATTIEVVGDPKLCVHVSSSAADTDFVAKLCDVDPTGVSRNIADGMVSLRWSDDGEVPRDAAPGDVIPLTIDLGLVGHSFGPAHRIRVQVASSAFPHYDRNMNTGAPPAAATAGVAAQQSVHRCRGRASYLCLPVVAGRLPDIDQGESHAP